LEFSQRENCTQMTVTEFVITLIFSSKCIWRTRWGSLQRSPPDLL